MLDHALLFFIFCVLSLASTSQISATTSRRPNVVFILSDDQDAKLNSLDYMPSVRKHLISRGTHFKSHYCTVAWCCPSRVSLWTGKAAHNTNVTNIKPPYDEGYQTYYVGKLMNHQHILNYNKPFPSGFNGTEFLLDPNTYDYMNPIFQRNEDPPIQYNGKYSTDLIHNKSINFLDNAAQDPETPFFLTIAPIAPHSNYNVQIHAGGELPVGIEITPPIAADRHRSFFSETSVPRGANFNPYRPSGVDWIASMPILTAENVKYNDHLYRQRLRSLQAVDEIVKGVFRKLEEYGILDNTYVFYSSDNGYHVGQHRLPPGKGCGFEEDINVPLIVRGPGVPSNTSVTFATSHTDLAPTWFNILGIPLRNDFDGVPIPLTEGNIEDLTNSGKAKEHVHIEYWALENPSEYNKEIEANNTYKGLRIVSEEYGWYYSVWCSGSHELYDMQSDPYQMTNLLAENNTNSTVALGRNIIVSISTLQTRLDALILVLKTCKGATCNDPWAELLPGRNVSTLAEAMDRTHDSYFAQLPRVSYSACEDGYILESEGPLWESAYGDVFVDVHSLARRESQGNQAWNRP